MGLLAGGLWLWEEDRPPVSENASQEPPDGTGPDRPDPGDASDAGDAGVPSERRSQRRPIPLRRPASAPERAKPEWEPPAGSVAFWVVEDEVEELTWEDAKQAVDDKVAEDVVPLIEECLDEWREADPSVEGEVKLGFTLDNFGLEKVEILDSSRDIPAGPVTCFATAVWDTGDWPMMTNGRLNYRVRLRFDESGLAAVPKGGG